MVVLDASAAIEWLLQTRRGLSVETRIFSPEESLHAPHLLDVEVAQALRRYVQAGRLSATRAQEALEDLRDLRLMRYPHAPFLRRIWQLRNNASAYDALYIALTEALKATLLTCDAKLASAANHHARIQLV